MNRDTLASRAMPGAILGLYLSRVIAEALPHAWRWWQLAPLIVVCLILGSAVSLVLARRYRTWPLSVALVYALWPQPSVQASWAVGLAVVVAWLLVNQIAERHTRWHDLALALAALTLYIRTLAPGLQPADAGEFQLVAATLGIAHPPGYPLYTMLGKLFTLLPLGNPAYLLNLFAAVCAAACVGVVSHAVGKASGSGWAALAAGACLAVTPTFWVQGTLANIRSLTALFVALGVAQTLRWERTRRTRDLTWLGLILGLGIGHHASLLLLTPAYAAYVLLHERRLILQPRRWLGMVGAALASLAVIAYLPIRSQMSPAFAPALVRSWDDLLTHVLARGFSGDMLRYTAWDELLRRGGALAQILRLEHGYLLLALVAVAAIACLTKRPRLLVLLGGIWLLNVLSAITYRAPQTVEYLMPSYVALALLLGLGLAGAARPGWPRAALGVTLALAIAAQGAASWPSLNTLHHDQRPRREAASLLAHAPADALILSGWHQATPLWYLQLVEGLRPDVTVTYVYPEGAMPNAEVWLRRIQAALPERAVLVTNRFHGYVDAGLLLEPLGSGWLVRATPLSAPPTSPVAVFGDQLALLDWEVPVAPLEPGEALSVTLILAALSPPTHDYTAFVQLVGPTGVVAQDDQRLPTARLAAGEGLRVQLEATLLPHSAPGDYGLIVGFYHSTEAGLERLSAAGGDNLTLGALQVQPRNTPTVSAHPLERRWANGLALIGLDVDRSVAGQTRLYVHLASRHDLAAEIVLVATTGSGTAQLELARALAPALAADRYALLALDLPADVEEFTLTLQDAAGSSTPLLGPWQRPRGVSLPLALSALGERYIPLGGAMALTDWNGMCRAASCALEAEFLTQQPLIRDYAISMGVRGAGETKSDGTPVTGAIPTLKWLAGWRVVDDRAMGLPAGLAPNRGTLTVYDSFTLRPLPVLDERLVRMGQGTELLLPLEP